MAELPRAIDFGSRNNFLRLALSATARNRYRRLNRRQHLHRLRYAKICPRKTAQPHRRSNLVHLHRRFFSPIFARNRNLLGAASVRRCGLCDFLYGRFGLRTSASHSHNAGHRPKRHRPKNRPGFRGKHRLPLTHPQTFRQAPSRPSLTLAPSAKTPQKLFQPHPQKQLLPRSKPHSASPL